MALDVHPNLLRALRTVLETGSLTAASERLGFTQSALSKQIAALETAAGAALLVRGSRGMTATEAGARLAARAAVVLDQLDAAAHELEVLQAPIGGRVALGGFPVAAAGLVPRSLARLRRQHPSVLVEFTEASTPVQLRRLRTGRLDLAILAAGDDLPAWDTTGVRLDPLAAGPLLLAVGETHRLFGTHRVDVSELRDEDWVVGRGARGEPQFGAWPTLREPRVIAELAEWSARLGFVAAGLGITCVPSLLVEVLPRAVGTVAVDDPDWHGRTTLLASIGDLAPATAAVRAALLAEAARAAVAAPHPPGP